MISGLVLGREPVIGVTIHGSQRRRAEIAAVVDSGFTGRLTLPRALIARLGLRRRGEGLGILADGRIVAFKFFEAVVEWDGRVRRVRVNQAETTPLVGMGLLAGYEFKMQVRSRGKVTIKRLPS